MWIWFYEEIDGRDSLEGNQEKDIDVDYITDLDIEIWTHYNNIIMVEWED